VYYYAVFRGGLLYDDGMETFQHDMAYFLTGLDTCFGSGLFAIYPVSVIAMRGVLVSRVCEAGVC
jgi:hypothetical protein